MALIKCKECGNQISDKAKSCPKCGAPPPSDKTFGIEAGGENKQKKSSGIGGVILIIVALFFIVPFFTDDSNTGTKSSTSSNSKKAIKTYNKGEKVHVGYMAYSVWDSWWADELRPGNRYDDPPDAKFLFVKLSARNDDKKERTIPPFKLIDESGAEYGTESRAYVLDDNISSLDNVNPGVKKTGVIVFDVPEYHSYGLQVSGGYWSSEDAYVKLDPKDNR